MEIYNLGDILPVLEDKSEVLVAVKQGFVAHSRGELDLPSPMQMIFARADTSIKGDCHVKAAASEAFPYFCIKVATGFYDNPKQGLPVNDGLVMLMSSDTGQPVALFQDEGHMTSVRTAAAGALAAQLVRSGQPKRLGIIGTGHQAELQALWIASVMDIESISLWGRSSDKANDLVSKLHSQGLSAQVVATIEDLTSQADILVTTTPSTQPVLMSNHIRNGHHIIAMGADSPGKQELDPQILAKADTIIADDVGQCVSHGEFGWATRAGLVAEDKAIPLGQVLAQAKACLSGEGLSVVDLTGLGAQDLALASFVYRKLASGNELT